MWSRFSRWLIGFVLLGLTGWFVTYVAHGWDHIWQREQATVAKSKSVSLIDPTLASDPSIAPAKVKVIGPLATVMEHEQQDPNATDSAAIAEPASSAQPTALDHVERPPPPHRADFIPLSWSRATGITSFWFLRTQAHPSFRGALRRLLPLLTRAQQKPSFLCSMTDNFSDLVHRGGENAVFSSTSSVGIIDVTLSSAPFESKKYYLVFRSPDRHARVVSADITASFE